MFELGTSSHSKGRQLFEIKNKEQRSLVRKKGLKHRFDKEKNLGKKWF